MSDHYINQDGTAIICRADVGQPCRMRPKCDTEAWGDITCNDHDESGGKHAVTHSQPCWLIEWINPFDLQDSYAELELVDPKPGAPVRINWEGDYATWEYKETHND